MLTFWVRLIFMADKFSRKAWSGSAHLWIRVHSGRSRCQSRTAGSALVTKDQHLSHGSGSQQKWTDFIWGSDFVVFLLWSEMLDPGADVPPRHGPASQGWKLSQEASVLGLNSEVGGRMKVRVMVRLGWWWGQTVHPPWGKHLSGHLHVQSHRCHQTNCPSNISNLLILKKWIKTWKDVCSYQSNVPHIWRIPGFHGLVNNNMAEVSCEHDCFVFS